jgi:O-antigen/teichoic acid export membrane protein
MNPIDNLPHKSGSGPLMSRRLKPSEFIGRILHYIGLDSAVLPTIVFRSWSIVAGSVMVFFIVVWLRPDEQGYYYTFSSLLGLQMFFELGLNQVVIQLVSHEYALLKPDATVGSYSGDLCHLARLQSIIALLKRWYTTAAGLFFVGVGVAGIYFFTSKGSLPHSSWLGPWILLTFSTAANLYLSVLMTVLEGCGQVANVARSRLVQSMIGYLLMWTIFALGGGLWAVPVVPLTSAIYTTWWISRQRDLIKHLLDTDLARTSSSNFSWRREILPMQWRIALSWVAGYFIFQLFTPLTFSQHGSVEAGRLGITMSLFNAILSVAMSWVSAKNPIMASHIALGERDQLNSVFRHALTRSMAFVALACIGVLGILAVGNQFNVPLLRRFASLDVTLCIALVTLANSFVFAAATFMRAHKEEPLLWQSITSGLLIGLATFITSRVSVLAMMVAYAVVTITVATPWAFLLFRTYYNRSMSLESL